MELLSRRPLLERLPRPPGRLTGYIGASTYFTSNLTGGSLDSHWHPVASFADARLCQTWHQLCRLGVTQWPSLHFHNMTQPSRCKTITRESKEARLSNANMTAAPFPATASALKGWPKSAGCGSYDGAAVCASPVCTGVGAASRRHTISKSWWKQVTLLKSQGSWNGKKAGQAFVLAGGTWSDTTWTTVTMLTSMRLSPLTDYSIFFAAYKCLFVHICTFFLEIFKHWLV